ncbi:MAG TPA: hypothetical protein VNN25_12105 [Thermoanaerobaculia bacterium]|nr:hypothetical protein [Thermoanaerobaculia bacterium]
MASDGAFEIIASLIVGVLTVVAALLTTRNSRRVSAEEEEIEKEVQRQTTDGEGAPVVVEGHVPSSLTTPEYEQLIAKLTSDLLKKRAFAQFGNQAVAILTRSYHKQALDQAKTQFWFGTVAATIGFAWILISGMFINNIAGTPKLIPGAIVGAVASLFLKQSHETRQRATDFYDRLQSYERQRESVTLVTSIQDSQLQGAAQTLLALHMAGASTGDAVTVLCRGSSERAVAAPGAVAKATAAG